ncbi:MAG TPA: PqiC family protein [Geminicoccaceae bacterium]|nr:PqiC family protein [Geminicoccaceae bacterium]
MAGCLLLASCAGTSPTRFYTLSSLSATPGETPGMASRDLTVAVGPVTLPEYLNRPQLVTRDGSNRVLLSDFDSWIEPVQGLFARTLVANLAVLLGTDDVLLLAQRRPVRPDYQVEVEVTRFDVDTGGNALLDARWWILDQRAETVLRSGRSTISQPAPIGNQAAAVQALSGALIGMSREIAGAIADHVES